MRLAQLTTAILFASSLVAGPVLADDLQPDQAMTVAGVEAVCTGTTTDTRADPRWKDYSLRLEFVGMSGQYLGDEQVRINGNGHSIDVHCAGPWVLMKLPQGTYSIATDVAEAGHKDMTAHVPASGQAHIVVRFPSAGGQEDKLPGKQASQ